VETSTTNAAAESAAASSPNAVDAANGPNASASRQQGTWSEQGIASWYGPRFQGKLTANGERFNTQTLTAAHKTLPFGTRVRVRSLSDAKEVIVRINDRGPFVKGRIIDLSQAAARVLGFVGVKQVVIERLP
jgi:rare lipoprotein A